MDPLRKEIYDLLSASPAITGIAGGQVYHRHMENYSLPALVYDLRETNGGITTCEGIQVEKEFLLTVRYYAGEELTAVNLARAADSTLIYYRSNNVSEIEKQRDVLDFINEFKQYIVTSEYLLSYQV